MKLATLALAAVLLLFTSALDRAGTDEFSGEGDDVRRGGVASGTLRDLDPHARQNARASTRHTAVAGASSVEGAHTPEDAAEEGGGAPPDTGGLSPVQVWQWREAARELLHHAYGGYMRHAYPADELRPLSCRPRWWHERERGDLDDALLGASLTLIDSLDALATTGDTPAFRCAVSRLVAEVSFDRDVPVSVFETNIRVVGGLVSAHMLSVDATLALWGEEGGGCPGGDCSSGCRAPGLPHVDFCPPTVSCLATYSGELLSMAAEVARRLLPAFATPTGLPYHRINLGSGVVDPASRASCTAAAGTFLLEFGLLSRLTGDPTFEAVARRAVSALWTRRSGLGLVGNAIDVLDGTWRSAHSGIGAGIDSFLEYLLKAGIALEDDELLEWWAEAAGAVAAHLDTPTARLHVEVGMAEGRGRPRPPLIVSPLQAWYPGAEVLWGAVWDGRAHWRSLASLWALHGALPEGYDAGAGGPSAWGRDSPLRPELAESTYHLYSATRDPSLLVHAAAQLHALNNASRVACGYASLADVTTGRLDDRMDSFFLAETGRYLFHTFDAALTGWFVGPPGTRTWSPPGLGSGEAQCSTSPRPPSRLALPATVHNETTAAWPFALPARVVEAGGGKRGCGATPAPLPLLPRRAARLAALYPGAHPLASVRYDALPGGANGTGDASATLPLDQERVLHTTEGHVVLLGQVPPPVLIRPPAPRKPAPGGDRRRGRGSSARAGGSASRPAVRTTPWLGGGPSQVCPRLAAHAHAAPPSRRLDFLDPFVEAWAAGRGGPSATGAKSAGRRSVQEAVCSVADLEGALGFTQQPGREGGDASSTGVDRLALGEVTAARVKPDRAVVQRPLPAGPPPSGSAEGTSSPALTHLAPWWHSGYPLRGSEDLTPGALVTAWSTSTMPALQADLLVSASSLARTIFNLPQGAASSSAAAEDGGVTTPERITTLTPKWDPVARDWTAEWTGQEVFPASRLSAALNAMPGLNLLVDDVSVRCDLRENSCGAVTGSAAAHIAYRVTARDGDTVERYLATGAQFGPLVTGSGMRPMRVWRDADALFDGCGAYVVKHDQDDRVLAVVARGVCSFADKARRAEAAGAVAVLVVDTSDAGQAVSFTFTPGAQVTADFVMAGDGTSTKPNIPAAFLPTRPMSGGLLSRSGANVSIAAAFHDTHKASCAASTSDLFVVPQMVLLKLVQALFTSDTPEERGLTAVFGTYECERV